MSFFAETAELAAVLKLSDSFSGPLKKADSTLSSFDKHLTDTQGRAYKAGQQIGTGLINGAKIAAAGIAGLVGLFAISAKEGQEAQNVQIKYAQAIQNSGKISAQYVTALNKQQDALLELSGADDEAIKAAQTQLIQMGLSGDKVLELTKLSLDLSQATGKDLTASALAVGKAFQGNNRALLQLGIVVPKGADAIAILNQRFKGTSEALSGQFDTRTKVFNERMANIRENIGIKLLPALTRLVDIVGSRLVPAFGNFVDRILPIAIDGLNKLADFLETGSATKAFDTFLTTAQTAAPIIADAADKTLSVVKSAVDLFGKLPPEIQALAVAGLTINKLTGGLVTNIAGGLIEAVISSFRGLMNVNAAVVNVNGAVSGPGNLLPNLAGGAAAAGAIGTGAAAAAIVGSVAATVIGSASVRSAIDSATDRAFLKAAAEAARKHGVSDANNAALKKLQAIEDAQLAAIAAVNSPTNVAQDTSEKAQQRRNAVFTSTPTRAELRARIALAEEAKKGAKSKDVRELNREIASDRARLAKRIADAAAKAQAQARALDRSIQGVSDTIRSSQPIVNITIPLNIDSRTFQATTNRYSDTFVNGVRPRVGGA